LSINITNFGYGSLDVVGKYTARSSPGQVSGLDVVVYTPTQISH
jgi:hypothetical protein